MDCSEYLLYRYSLIVVKKFLEEFPETSDRQVGKIAGVDHKTVGVVRKDLQSRGEIPHVSTRTDSLGRSQPSTKPVAKVRTEMESTSEIPRSNARLGADGRTTIPKHVNSPAKPSPKPEPVNPVIVLPKEEPVEILKVETVSVTEEVSV